MWQLFLIFYFIFGTTSYLLRRILAQKLGGYNKLINASFFVFFLLPAIFILTPLFPHNVHVGITNILLLLAGSLIFPLANIIAFRANKDVEVGIFTILNNVSPVFTITFATLFLHERLTGPQLVGAGILILSGAIAAFSLVKRVGKASLYGISLCLISALLLGISITYERFMFTRVDFGAYLIYGWGSQVIWSTLLAYKDLSKLPKLFSKELGARKIVLLWGAANILKSVSFILALKSSSASLMSTSSNFMTVTVVIGAYFFLKERKHLVYKVVAIILGTCGLLLITR